MVQILPQRSCKVAHTHRRIAIYKRTCARVHKSLCEEGPGTLLAYRFRISGLSSSANTGKPSVIISHVIKISDGQSHAAGQLIDCPVADPTRVKMRNRACVGGSILPARKTRSFLLMFPCLSYHGKGQTSL